MTRGSGNRRGLLELAPLVAVQAAVGAVVGGASVAGVGGTVAAGVALTVLAVGAVAVVVAPSLVLVAPVVASYGVNKLGGGLSGFSIADLALIAGGVVAVPFVPWRSRWLQFVLGTLAAYLLLLVPVLASHPTSFGIVEWAQRALTVGGGVLVGAALAHRGRARAALLAYLAVSAVFATVAIAIAVESGFAPAYPGIHKNAAGVLLMFAVLVTVAARRTLALPTPVLAALRAVLLLGMAATQSRASVLGLIAGVAWWAVKNRRLTLSPLAVVGAAVLGGMLWISVGNLLREPDTAASRFNSLNSRTITYEVAIEIWQLEPWLGQGLLYWRDPELSWGGGFGEPHNVIFSTLGESGLVGLAAFTLLVGRVVWRLRREREELVQLAVIAIVARFVESLLSIWWVGGTQNPPWLFLGLAVGTLAMRDQAPRPAVPEPAPVR